MKGRSCSNNMVINVAFVFYLKDSLGGAERRIIRIYNELCTYYQHINCCIIVRGCEKETALSIFDKCDCNTESIGEIKAFKNNVGCLVHIVRNRKYDIVHYFDASRYNNCLQLVCGITNKRTIYSICSYAEAYNACSKKHMKWVHRQLKYANCVDLLNPLGEDKIIKHIKKAKLTITPGTFTDLNVFKPATKEKIMLYSAARLEESKNPMLLFRAINLCQRIIRTNEYKVIVLGKGEYEKILKDYIKDNGLSDILHMVGYRKVSEYMPVAKVFFSLQQLENYPSQSLAEATACGCYSIITDVGDSRKCANDCFAKFIEAEPKYLASAIVEYIDMKETKKKNIIFEARRFAEEFYSIERSIEYFKKLVEGLVK